MHRRIKDESGFTLIEALIAAILLAMLATLFFEGYSSVQGTQAKTCEIKLLAISASERQYRALRAEGQPAQAECTATNALINGLQTRLAPSSVNCPFCSAGDAEMGEG